MVRYKYDDILTAFVEKMSREDVYVFINREGGCITSLFHSIRASIHTCFATSFAASLAASWRSFSSATNRCSLSCVRR